MAVFLGCTSTGWVGLCFLWFYVQELPKAQPAVVLVLKRLRRRGNGLKSHPTDWEKPGIEPATPGLQDIGLSPTPRRLLRGSSKSFCGFPWVETSTAGRVYDLCVYYMTGAPEGSPKVVLCRFFLWFYGEAGNRTCDPWFTRHSAYPLHHGGFSFFGFPWVETSTAGRVYDLCVYYMTGAPEGSPKVVLCGGF